MTLFFLGTGLSPGGDRSCRFAGDAGRRAGGPGLFAAIYHPIGTTMLVEAAGDKPGRAIGVNGVFGNLGVALAPVVTAFLANQSGWRAAFIAPGLRAPPLGLAWLRLPLAEAVVATGERGRFPPIPRHLVRRAVMVLMLIAIVSGLVFNAFTLLLPKLMEERLATIHGLLPLVGVGGISRHAVRRAHPVHRRPDDRPQDAEAGVPAGERVLVPAMVAVSYAQGWIVLPMAALVAAAIFGQVTVNETMAARYISPALRARMYSVRFFVGFLGAAAAAPVVAWLHERTGSVAVVTLVLAGFRRRDPGMRAVLPGSQGGAAAGSLGRRRSNGR